MDRVTPDFMGAARAVSSVPEGQERGSGITRSTSASSLWRWCIQDWTVNEGYRDSQLILLWFRTAQWAHRRGGRLGQYYVVLYRLLTSLVCSVELPAEMEAGPRLRLFHPHSVVINPRVRLGSDCILRQNVTVGNIVRRDGSEKGVASIGNAVEFGAGCVVVGGIHVGDHARIGALALVTSDVPEWAVMVGNPAQVVRIDSPERVAEGPSGSR